MMSVLMWIAEVLFGVGKVVFFIIGLYFIGMLIQKYEIYKNEKRVLKQKRRK